MATYKKCLADGCERNSKRWAAGKLGYCSMHYSRVRTHGDPDVVARPPSPAKDWILAHVAHQGDACLTWPFAVGEDGYGRVHHFGNGHLTTASRVMCILAHGGPPSQRHEAAHKCGMGNRACVNPRHLYWALPATNHADKIGHGTTNRGERQGSSRLTEEQVREIRRLLAARAQSQDEIAAMFGVCRSHISDIKRGKRWGWMP